MPTLRSLAAALLLPLLAASCADLPTTSPEQARAPDGAVRSTGGFWISCPSSLLVGGSGYCNTYFTSGGYPSSWWSTNPSVVSVSSFGQIYARAPGSATIYAYGNGHTSSSYVRVYAPPTVTRVTVSPAMVYVGITVQLTARVYDQYGNEMTGRTVAWSIDDPGIASISAGGAVTGQSLGSTVARATVDGVAGAGTVSVQTYQPYVPPGPDTATM